MESHEKSWNLNFQKEYEPCIMLWWYQCIFIWQYFQFSIFKQKQQWYYLGLERARNRHNAN